MHGLRRVEAARSAGTFPGKERLMRYAALSDVGRVRKNNEDSWHADGRVFVVADGMGGHQAGEVASSVAVERFLGYDLENRHLPPMKRLNEGILAANDLLASMAAETPGLEGMGTTFTALVLEEGAFLGHVGDSRAYLLRDGRLTSLTRDHSLVAKMVREGFLTPRQARVHPRRNVILRALGMERRLVVDLASPDLRAGDRVLLCTDGLTSGLDDEELEAILAGVEDPEECCRRLVMEANARGGEDNITVVVIDLEEGDVPRGRAAGKGGAKAGEAKGRWWKRR